MSEVQEARHEAREALSAHEIECERRYGELRTRLAKIEVATQRNTTLMRVVLGTQLTLAAGIVASATKLI